MSDRLRHKDFVIEVTTVIKSGQPTALGKHDPIKMKISLPRVRFLDDIGQDKPSIEPFETKVERGGDKLLGRPGLADFLGKTENVGAGFLSLRHLSQSNFL